MAKRIEFIAPVEAIRGNMSGRQDLVYAENDNKAFEAPQGSVNYARNYTPRFIGAKRASNGRKYFTVRTKNGVNLTAKSMKAMALLGGTGAIYAAIVNSDTLRNSVDLVYRFLIDRTRQGLPGGIPVNTTFRKYVSGVIRETLNNKAATITFAGGAGVQQVKINNPWIGTGTGTEISIAQTVLVRFWTQLSVNAIYFYVDEQKAIAEGDDDFDVLSAANYNILGISTREIGDTRYAVIGERYLKYNGEYLESGENIIANARYTTTEVAPA